MKYRNFDTIQFWSIDDTPFTFKLSASNMKAVFPQFHFYFGPHITTINILSEK